MKKLFLGLTIVSLLTFVLVFAFVKMRNGQDKETNLLPLEKRKLKTALRPEAAQLKPAEKSERVAIKVKPFSLDADEIEELLQEFDISQAEKKKLTKGIKQGQIDREWGKEEISEEELRQAGLTRAQIASSTLSPKGANLVAGYEVSEQTFEQIIKVSSPEKTEDFTSESAQKQPSIEAPDKQTEILTAETLANLGFFALAELKYAQAEQAFKTLLSYYPDCDVAAMVQLELARLLLEQGRQDQARQLVEEAIKRHSADQEYLAIAEDLKEKIEGNE